MMGEDKTNRGMYENLYNKGIHRRKKSYVSTFTKLSFEDWHITVTAADARQNPPPCRSAALGLVSWSRMKYTDLSIVIPLEKSVTGRSSKPAEMI